MHRFGPKLDLDNNNGDIDLSPHHHHLPDEGQATCGEAVEVNARRQGLCIPGDLVVALGKRIIQDGGDDLADLVHHLEINFCRLFQGEGDSEIVEGRVREYEKSIFGVRFAD